MQEFFETYHLPSLLKASWQGAVLILLLLAAQWALGRRLSPRWRYGLWLLVVARLALPWTIPSAISVFNLVGLPTNLWIETARPEGWPKTTALGRACGRRPNAAEKSEFIAFDHGLRSHPVSQTLCRRHSGFRVSNCCGA